MKIRLIDDWHQAWKLGSVQTCAFFASLFSFGPDVLHYIGYVGSSLLGTWAMIPQDLKDALPQGTGRWVAVAAFGLILTSRIFKFERKPVKQDDDYEHA